MPSEITMPFKHDRGTTAAIGVMGFSILLYDHIITLPEEIEYIWRKKKQAHTYLFLLNRYLTPLGFIVNLWAYLWTDWTHERCGHFVRYEGVMYVIGINIVELMMMTRIRGLYYSHPQKKLILGLVAVIFFIELSVNSVLVVTGKPAQDVGPCSMIYDLPGHWRHFASLSAWLPLLYDTVIFILTLYRTLERRESEKRKSVVKSPILKVMFREGLLYYSVICSVTLVLAIMINAARPGIRNITAQLELLLTVAMMSRITLDLKASKNNLGNGNWMSPPANFNPGVASHDSYMIFRHNEPPFQVMSIELQQGTDWSRDLEQIEDRVTPPMPSRPRPARWRSFTAQSQEVPLEGEGATASAP